MSTCYCLNWTQVYLPMEKTCSVEFLLLLFSNSLRICNDFWFLLSKCKCVIFYLCFLVILEVLILLLRCLEQNCFMICYNVVSASYLSIFVIIFMVLVPVSTWLFKIITTCCLSCIHFGTGMLFRCYIIVYLFMYLWYPNHILSSCLTQFKW